MNIKHVDVFSYLYAKYDPMPSPIFCGSDTVISMKKSECSSVDTSSIVLLPASGWIFSQRKKGIKLPIWNTRRWFTRRLENTPKINLRSVNVVSCDGIQLFRDCNANYRKWHATELYHDINFIKLNFFSFHFVVPNWPIWFIRLIYHCECVTGLYVFRIENW